MSIWILNLIIAILTGVSILCWGYCIKDVGLPVLSLGFLIKLAFSKFFIMAMGLGFIAALLKYFIVQDLGVLKASFFLMTSSIAIILVSVFLLGEKITFWNCFGIVLVLSGVWLLGT